MLVNSPKRNRGFMLSLVGWKKLQARISQIEHDRGGKLTQQRMIKQIQLIDAQGLHPITLRKILGRQVGVDERSLRLVFQGIGLELDASDFELAAPKVDEDISGDSAADFSSILSPTSVADVAPDFPGGPVPLDSPFYIEPTRLLTSAYQEIGRPGGLVRIKAPQRSGKSSFALRLLHHANMRGYKTLKIDFQQVDEALFSSLDRFLRWFCATLSYQLDLEPMIQQCWHDEMGSKVSCTIYLQKVLLKSLESPVVLVLNEVNRLFKHPAIAQEFLPLLRSWYEEARYHPVLQRLHFVLLYSTEIYVSLHLNQSPFNIGLPIKLEDLSLDEIQQLAMLYKLPKAVVPPLYDLVGGRPYLIQLGLYYLYNHQISLQQLLQEATTLIGIYSNHLRGCLANLQQDPELLTAFQQILDPNGQGCCHPTIAYKLESLGLIKLDLHGARPSCKLYQQFFTNHLSQLTVP